MRTGSFETDTDRAAKSLARFKKEAVQTAKEVGAVLGVAAVAAGTALVAMTKQAIDSADALNDLSERTGIAIESLSALQYAAEIGDVANEELAAGLVKLARVMSEAANGAAAPAAAFDALGVAVKNADGTLRGTDAVLADLATRFASYADGAEKTALAQEIFGKSGAQLIPLLNQGADGMQRLKDEAKALGIVIDTETARAAGDFNDTLTKLGKGVDSFGITLARAALPALKAIADEFVRARTDGDSLVPSMESLRAVFNGVATGAAYATTFVSIFGKQIGAVIGQIGLLIDTLRAPPGELLATAASNWRQYTAISDAVAADVRKALQTRDAFLSNIAGGGSNSAMAAALGLGSIEAAAGPRSRAPRLPGAGGGSRGAGAAAARRPETYGDSIAQSVAQAITSSDVVKARELADQIAYLDELFFKAGLDADIYESAMRKITGQTSSAKDATSEFLREQERLAQLLGATASSQLEEQREDMLLLTKAYEEGRISVEKYLEAVQARLGGAKGEGEKTKTIAEEIGLTFTSAFEDAIVGGKGLRETLKGIGQDLLRLTTRKLITEPLSQMFADLLKPDAGGSGGGLLSGIGSFISGAIGGLFGGGRAYGGPVNAGSMYRVNERGSPEMLEIDGKEFLMMGNRRGWVNPNTGGGSSSRTINAPITINMPQGSTAATASQAGSMVARRLRIAELRNA